METKEAYMRQLEARLALCSAKINAFSDHGDNAPQEIKVQIQEEFERLLAQQRKAADKLTELEHAHNDNWEPLKAGIDKIWAELEEVIADDLSQLN